MDLHLIKEKLACNASQGVVNKVSDVRLLQGDLAESWLEGDQDYATVAMRYTVIDMTIDRASGRLVEGSASLKEIAEFWTFMRKRHGQWILSAIQQT